MAHVDEHEDGNVGRICRPTLEVVLELPALTAIRSAAFNPKNGQVCTSYMESNTISLWALGGKGGVKGELRRSTLPVPVTAGILVLFMEEIDSFVAVSSTRVFILGAALEVRFDFLAHERHVLTAIAHQRNSEIIVAGIDGKLKAFRIETHRSYLERSTREPFTVTSRALPSAESSVEGWISLIHIDEEAERMFIASDASVALVDYQEKTVLVPAQLLHTHAIWSMETVRLEGRLTLLTSAGDSLIRIWSMDDKFVRIGELRGHTRPPCDILHDKTLNVLISLSEDAWARTWNLEEGRELDHFCLSTAPNAIVARSSTSSSTIPPPRMFVYETEHDEEEDKEEVEDASKAPALKEDRYLIVVSGSKVFVVQLVDFASFLCATSGEIISSNRVPLRCHIGPMGMPLPAVGEGSQVENDDFALVHCENGTLELLHSDEGYSAGVVMPAIDRTRESEGGKWRVLAASVGTEKGQKKLSLDGKRSRRKGGRKGGSKKKKGKRFLIDNDNDGLKLDALLGSSALHGGGVINVGMRDAAQKWSEVSVTSYELDLVSKALLESLHRPVKNRRESVRAFRRDSASIASVTEHDKSRKVSVGWNPEASIAEPDIDNELGAPLTTSPFHDFDSHARVGAVVAGYHCGEVDVVVLRSRKAFVSFDPHHDHHSSNNNKYSDFHDSKLSDDWSLTDRKDGESGKKEEEEDTIGSKPVATAFGESAFGKRLAEAKKAERQREERVQRTALSSVERVATLQSTSMRRAVTAVTVVPAFWMLNESFCHHEDRMVIAGDEEGTLVGWVVPVDADGDSKWMTTPIIVKPHLHPSRIVSLFPVHRVGAVVSTSADGSVVVLDKDNRYRFEVTWSVRDHIVSCSTLHVHSDHLRHSLLFGFESGAMEIWRMPWGYRSAAKEYSHARAANADAPGGGQGQGQGARGRDKDKGLMGEGRPRRQNTIMMLETLGKTSDVFVSMISSKRLEQAHTTHDVDLDDDYDPAPLGQGKEIDRMGSSGHYLPNAFRNSSLLSRTGKSRDAPSTKRIVSEPLLHHTAEITSIATLKETPFFLSTSQDRTAVMWALRPPKGALLSSQNAAGPTQAPGSTATQGQLNKAASKAVRSEGGAVPLRILSFGQTVRHGLFLRGGFGGLLLSIGSGLNCVGAAVVREAVEKAEALGLTVDAVDEEEDTGLFAGRTTPSVLSRDSSMESFNSSFSKLRRRLSSIRGVGDRKRTSNVQQHSQKRERMTAASSREANEAKLEKKVDAWWKITGGDKGKDLRSRGSPKKGDSSDGVGGNGSRSSTPKRSRMVGFDMPSSDRSAKEGDNKDPSSFSPSPVLSPASSTGLRSSLKKSTGIASPMQERSPSPQRLAGPAPSSSLSRLPDQRRSNTVLGVRGEAERTRPSFTSGDVRGWSVVSDEQRRIGESASDEEKEEVEGGFLSTGPSKITLASLQGRDNALERDIQKEIDQIRSKEVLFPPLRRSPVIIEKQKETRDSPEKEQESTEEASDAFVEGEAFSGHLGSHAPKTEPSSRQKSRKSRRKRLHLSPSKGRHLQKRSASAPLERHEDSWVNSANASDLFPPSFATIKTETAEARQPSFFLPTPVAPTPSFALESDSFFSSEEPLRIKVIPRKTPIARRTAGDPNAPTRSNVVSSASAHPLSFVGPDDVRAKAAGFNSKSPSAVVALLSSVVSSSSKKKKKSRKKGAGQREMGEKKRSKSTTPLPVSDSTVKERSFVKRLLRSKAMDIEASQSPGKALPRAGPVGSSTPLPTRGEGGISGIFRLNEEWRRREDKLQRRKEQKRLKQKQKEEKERQKELQNKADDDFPLLSSLERESRIEEMEKRLSSASDRSFVPKMQSLQSHVHGREDQEVLQINFNKRPSAKEGEGDTAAEQERAPKGGEKGSIAIESVVIGQEGSRVGSRSPFRVARDNARKKLSSVGAKAFISLFKGTTVASALSTLSLSGSEGEDEDDTGMNREQKRRRTKKQLRKSVAAGLKAAEEERRQNLAEGGAANTREEGRTFDNEAEGDAEKDRETIAEEALSVQKGTDETSLVEVAAEEAVERSEGLLMGQFAAVSFSSPPGPVPVGELPSSSAPPKGGSAEAKQSEAIMEDEKAMAATRHRLHPLLRPGSGEGRRSPRGIVGVRKEAVTRSSSPTRHKPDGAAAKEREAADAEERREGRNADEDDDDERRSPEGPFSALTEEDGLSSPEGMIGRSAGKKMGGIVRKGLPSAPKLPKKTFLSSANEGDTLFEDERLDSAGDLSLTGEAPVDS